MSEKEKVAKTNKIFVLDTNVILHDYECIYLFEENDIVVPVSVLEEIESFQKGNKTINSNAREFIKSLDKISGPALYNGGVSIAPGKGKIRVKYLDTLQKTLKDKGIMLDETGHHVLNMVSCIMSNEASNHRKRPVVLVTKNAILRMKAQSIGFLAEDYTSDYVENVEEFYKKPRVIENVSKKFIEELYKNNSGLMFHDFVESIKTNPLNNEFFILKNGSSSVLATFDANLERVRRVRTEPCVRIKPRNTEQIFALDALMNEDISLITITGKAGTGKTLLALAAAIEQRKKYREIMLARPTVPLSNRDMGFLPGDIDSKISPYVMPLNDNLSVIKNGSSEFSSSIVKMQEENKIHIEALAYIRGRSLMKAYFIIDEAQNLSPHEVKTIVTRAGEGTKIIFTGDIFQIDHPYLNTKSNGLSHVINRMQGQKRYAHVNLEKGERSELAELAANLL